MGLLARDHFANLVSRQTGLQLFTAFVTDLPNAAIDVRWGLLDLASRGPAFAVCVVKN
jgi:hypothetical protein